MARMTTTQELTWSAFLREPTQVEPMLKKGDVILKRRDGEPLRLTREVDDDLARKAIAAAARLFAAAVDEQVTKVGQKVETELPWTHFLPDDVRQQFVKEFITEFKACADLGDFTALGRMLVSWKSTARVYADGLDKILMRPIPKVLGKRVPRPK